jgi:FkbM family methyltransferase
MSKFLNIFKFLQLRRFLYLLIGTVFVVSFYILLIKKDSKEEKNTTFVSNNQREPQNVLFDLGANIGDSARFYADPTFVSNDNPPHELHGICTKDNKKWTIYSFEANPLFNNKLDEVKKIVESYGHTHNVFKETAAWISNEDLVFYLDTVNPGNNFWGSSLHAEHKYAQRSNYKNVTVKGVDISVIIDQYSIEDYIILKIDIEGSEYALLEHLIKQGTIHKVDYITIEYHNIFKNDTITYYVRLKFYNTFFKIYKIPYTPWFMGHKKFSD